jgi:hypothetical protein
MIEHITDSRVLASITWIHHQKEEMRHLLAEIYHCFTKGFETKAVPFTNKPRLSFEIVLPVVLQIWIL